MDAIRCSLPVLAVAERPQVSPAQTEYGRRPNPTPVAAGRGIAPLARARGVQSIRRHLPHGARTTALRTSLGSCGDPADPPHTFSDPRAIASVS
jgi:hypothetical protein